MKTIIVRTSTVLDIGEAKLYLRGVRAMADEAVRSSDPRVILLALQILAEAAPTTIRRILRRVA